MCDRAEFSVVVGQVQPPLFTADDVEQLRFAGGWLRGEHVGPSDVLIDVKWDDIADRIQRWLDQEANTTHITPHPNWFKA
jgi:hypothetical protein